MPRQKPGADRPQARPAGDRPGGDNCPGGGDRQKPQAKGPQHGGGLDRIDRGSLERGASCPPDRGAMKSLCWGKLLIEDIFHFLSRIEGVGVAILRAANPVGVWQVSGRHGLVAAAIKNSALSIFGSGNNRCDYFDADGLVALIAGFAREDRRICRTFNIGSGIPRTELEIVALVEKVLKCKMKYE